MRLAVALTVLLVATLAMGCRTVRAPVLGSGRLEHVDGTLFEDVLLAMRSAGYRPEEVDAEHGRFELVARSDGRGETRFVVQCYADGWVGILPVGPRVTDTDDGRLELPIGMRDEYARIAEELDVALATHR